MGRRGGGGGGLRRGRTTSVSVSRATYAFCAALRVLDVTLETLTCLLRCGVCAVEHVLIIRVFDIFARSRC